MSILVETAGFLTTIQDGGRHGFQQYGVTVSGALDREALATANILVGNSRDEAGLELTLAGPRLVFRQDAVLAVTGGDLEARQNGVPLDRYRAVSFRAGDVLDFGACQSGCRAYIAFAGGLNTPPALGSRSTDRRALLGGLEGRCLKKGDILPLRSDISSLPNMPRRHFSAPLYSRQLLLRVVPGPQEDAFTPEGIRTFYSAAYTVGPKSDRMGCRLEGPPIRHMGDGNIISDGVATGSIQVPENGLPMVLLADRQTTGGYAKIATVITADLPLLAQCRGGETLRFEAVEVESAQSILLLRHRALQQLENSLRQPLPPNSRDLHIHIEGTRYHVLVEPGKETE